jgi:hypothetical protein
MRCAGRFALVGLTDDFNRESAVTVSQQQKNLRLHSKDLGGSRN